MSAQATVTDLPTDDPAAAAPAQAGLDTAMALGFSLVAAVAVLALLRSTLGQRAQPGHVHAGTVDVVAAAAMWLLVSAGVKAVAFRWPDTSFGRAAALLG